MKKGELDAAATLSGYFQRDCNAKIIETLLRLYMRGERN